MVEIVNILATGNIEREIDLNQVSEDTVHSKYEPDDFPGLVFKFKNIGTVVLFSSGKYTVTGIKNKKSLQELENEFFNRLQNIGVHLENPTRSSVQNIVCTGDINQELNLSQLAVHLGMSNIEYEPEQSPFLVYRPKSEECVMTVASTGKTVITGIKTIKKAEQAFSDLIDEISYFDT